MIHPRVGSEKGSQDLCLESAAPPLSVQPALRDVNTSSSGPNRFLLTAGQPFIGNGASLESCEATIIKERPPRAWGPAQVLGHRTPPSDSCRGRLAELGLFANMTHFFDSNKG